MRAPLLELAVAENAIEQQDWRLGGGLFFLLEDGGHRLIPRRASECGFDRSADWVRPPGWLFRHRGIAQLDRLHSSRASSYIRTRQSAPPPGSHTDRLRLPVAIECQK